jgi:DNA-binding SARP family transcriptional activator/WD40 repeat protein
MALDVLAIRRNRVVSPDELADAIWGDAPPASWSKQVQICVSRLRRVLGATTIETAPGGYRLHIDESELDAGRFEEQIARGRGFAATGEPDRAAASYARALALWRGHPYADLDGWDPGRIEADRLLEFRLSAQEEWMEARLAAGDHRAVSVEAGTLVAEEPLREKRWHVLALAQYRSGRQADALRSLARARTILREELGIDPGPELMALQIAILQQDVALAAIPEPAPLNPECPYRGLAAYDVDDDASFFGRATEVVHCLERLRATPLLVLAGPSGSGKSSLARAGLAAALRDAGRPVAVFVPGTEPDDAMTSAIASAVSAPALVVDQFEELFALGVPEQEVAAFCDRLAGYASDDSPAIVVIRSDYLGGLSVSRRLSRLAEQGLHLVAPLSGAALREAIEQPAANAGVRLEHGLVDLLERDTEGEPGSLPMLSHALAETWRRRDGLVLTVEGYRASGGIRGAVAHSADRLYDSLQSEQRGVLRSLLLRMVTPSLDGPPVRCRVPARSVLGDPDRDRVVGLLVRSRLVTVEEDSYELAHEALARAWPRLQAWMEDDAEGQRTMRHLVARADDWDTSGRPDSELYRGGRLESVIEWRDHAHPDLTSVEIAFLDASAALRASDIAAVVERARAQSRQNRNLRLMLVGTAVFLVAAVLAGALAITGREDARLEALVNRSLSLRATDRGVAALLAVEAHRRSADARTWSALLGTFTGAPGFMGYQYVPDADGLSGALIPGTSKAVVAINGEGLRLIDRPTGEVSAPFNSAETEASWGTGDASWGTGLAVSDDGRYLAHYGAQDGSDACWSLDSLRATDDEGCALLQVFELDSGRQIMAVVPPFGLGKVAIGPDGSHVAVTGGFDGDLAIYRTSDAERVGVVEGVSRPAAAEDVFDVAGVAFGSDGRLFVGSMAGPVRVVSVATGEVLETWDAPPFSSSRRLEVTDAGRVVGAGRQGIVAFDSAGVQLWMADLQDGRHPEPCPWFAVNGTRDTLYCGNFYGVIEERSLLTGAPTGVRLDPQQGSVGTMEVTADGDELVVFGGGSPTISAWRFDGAGPIQRLVASGHVAYDGYSLDGESMLVAKRGPTQASWDEFTDFSVWDPETDVVLGRILGPMEGMGWAGPHTLTGFDLVERRIRYLDADTLETLEALEVPEENQNLFVSAGGEWQYITFPGGEVWTVDPVTRQRVEPTFKLSGQPFSASATRHGDRVVASSWDAGDAVIAVFDGKTGEKLAETRDGTLVSAVSLDGTVVGALDGKITEYDPETLEPVGTYPGARGFVNTLQFSEDGTVLLAGANDQTVSVFDVATRSRIGDIIPTFSPFISPGHLRPDGREIAVNQRDGVVLWDIDPGRLADAACRLAGRNLTESEWSTYLADFGPYRETCS